MSASLDAKSVLVLEDQFLIALDAEQALRKAGALDVRLASSVSEALRILASFAPEVAVLDFVLGDGTGVDVAQVLTERQVPFAFATGYGDSVPIPANYRHVPVVQKPFGIDDLVLQLNRAMTPAGPNTC
ncbi:response regulator [uncultured Reyranella sp.]|uniref:response regulator n=1 Tax=uncultured Reyranella sp. TaxID=735512 RepID=UPI0025DBB4DA|nr:response regulator [uncultured Reyranella sp.]